MVDIVDESSNNIVDENGAVLIDGTKEFGFAFTASSTLVEGVLKRERGVAFAANSNSTLSLAKVERNMLLDLAVSPTSTISAGMNLTIVFRFAVGVTDTLGDENGDLIVDETGTRIGVQQKGSSLQVKQVNREQLHSFEFTGISTVEQVGALLRERGYGLVVNSEGSLIISPRLIMKLNMPFAVDAKGNVRSDLFMFKAIGGNKSLRYDDILRR